MARRTPLGKQSFPDTITDHVRSHRRFITDMRLADKSLGRAQSVIDESVVDGRQLRAVDRCLTDIELYPPEDPNHVAARYELVFVTSWPYRLWLKLIAGPNRVLRFIGRELIYAGFLPVQLILIVIFNAAAFLLVWWLLFSF